MVGRAKYDAWAELKGLAANDAMQQYIDLVAQLKKA
jgi:acyl-CoA-binding protein